MKKRLFPQQSGDSSTDEEAFADSENDASLSGGDTSLAPQTDKLVIFKCGDFVIAHVHTAAGKCKKFIKKLVSGPDEIKTLKSVFWRGQETLKMDLFFQKWKT